MAKKASTKTTKTVKTTKPVKTTKATKPVVKTTEPVKEPNPPKKKKSKAWIPIVAVVGALALVGAGVGIYFLLNREPDVPKQRATIKLDDESAKKYGSLDGGPIVNISNFIGTNDFKVAFTPKKDFVDANFDVTIESGDKQFTATYISETATKTIKVSGATLENGDELIAKLMVQPAGFTVTLNADEGVGHFNKGVDDIERSISGISEGTNFGDVLKEINESPILDVDLGESKTRLTGGKFAYYVDGNGNTISDSYKISGNLNVTARYSLDCFGLENTSNEADVHLTLTNGGSGTATNPPEVYYTIESDSSDYLKNWTEWNYANGEITIEKGKKVYFKGNNPNGFSNIYNYSKFTFKLTDAEGDLPEETKVLAHGNIMSLLDDGACNTTTIPGNGSCFNSLFNGFIQLDIASDFSMPATTLADSCYSQMFQQCESLSTIPDLSNIKKGATMAFQFMFNICNGLTSVEADKLPDFDSPEDMGVQMCQGMFQNCRGSLLDIDITPLTKFNSYPNSCFTSMFNLTKIGSLKVGFGNPNDSDFWPNGATAGNNPTDNWLTASDPGYGNISKFIWKGVTKEQLDSSLLDGSHIPTAEAWKVEVYE